MSTTAFSVNSPSVWNSVIWLSLGSARQLILTKHAKEWTVWHYIQWILRLADLRHHCGVGLCGALRLHTLVWLIDWLIDPGGIRRHIREVKKKFPWFGISADLEETEIGTIQWRSQQEAQGARAPSKTLGIFCHKSLQCHVSSIGAVQKGGFCL